ncbi:ring finger protein [Lichtheimia corymbifera JMRC:FSU:9682]|uniref:RBR-type E3 ubiquitin transferase n=1 Tax=Lichtheimia corymbifera JMRC:FSU:9682 TaxID=1263082 RepID=A0A068RL11_9FUNG|nr:ring finger protein [Lichtheimia corymbifera JMRC:FSU:9682]
MSHCADPADIITIEDDDSMDDNSMNESIFGDSMNDSEEDDNDDVCFDTEDRREKKAYEVDYVAHNTIHLRRIQNVQIDQVVNILGLANQEAAILLRYFQWNKEKLFERYTDSPEKVLESAGLVDAVEKDRQVAPTLPAKRVKNSFTCEICFDDDPDMETTALSCEHRFCNTCYEHYLRQKIIEEGECRNIQCPQDKCNRIVDEKTVSLLVDDKVKSRYSELLDRTFVDDNDAMRWCPAPDCEYAIECHIPSVSLSSIVPTVECGEGHKFCFGCGLSDHQPCVCSLVKKWLQKCKDDSETANWISAHTKDCPKCQSAIEKNGGCNHMTCRKCRYEFCWVCMGPWSEHRSQYYACNRFDERSATEARENQAKSRASLERYLHYYNRFANHDQSAKLDQELYRKTEQKMEEVQQNSDLSWIEVQFLKKAVDTTVECRMTLKWTYAFAFYLDRTHQTAIFEDNQRDLEMATEHLSELLDKPLEPESIAQLRQNVLDKTVYVKHRRDILLEDTLKGLQDGRWNFFVDIE